MTWFGLATVERGGPHAALLLDDGGLVVPDELVGTTVRDLLADWDTALPLLGKLAAAAASADERLPAGTPLLTPVRYPDALLAVGANYAGHLKEMDLTVQRWATMPFFHRPPRTCLVGPGDTVQIPESTAQFDWECELAVIIGRRLHRASQEEARAAVAGYSVGLDLTCRDLVRTGDDLGVDLSRGKAQDTMAPCGPVLVPATFVPDDGDLRLTLSVNDRSMMDASTAEMLWPVDELLAEISRYTTLAPGDIVFTGSPAGSAGEHGGCWLQPGDRIDATITYIPTLTVTMQSTESL